MQMNFLYLILIYLIKKRNIASFYIKSVHLIGKKIPYSSQQLDSW